MPLFWIGNSGAERPGRATGHPRGTWSFSGVAPFACPASAARMPICGARGPDRKPAAFVRLPGTSAGQETDSATPRRGALSVAACASMPLRSAARRSAFSRKRLRPRSAGKRPPRADAPAARGQAAAGLPQPREPAAQGRGEPCQQLLGLRGSACEPPGPQDRRGVGDLQLNASREMLRLRGRSYENTRRAAPRQVELEG